MAEPLVVVAARQFKQQLLAREADQMRFMAKRWMEVEAMLDANIYALARQIDDKYRGGEYVSPSSLYRLKRFRLLRRQTLEEFEKYAEFADKEISAQQLDYGRLGIDHGVRSVSDVYAQGGVIGEFTRLPISAIENMAGLAGNGKPVGELLKNRVHPDYSDEDRLSAWAKMSQTLLNSTAAGINPTVTARKMKDDLAGGLQKALLIARTEQIRVYRLGNQQQFEESGVVEGHRRLAAHDERTCLACLADEGTVYPVTVPISDHPGGRCTSVPVVTGMPYPEFETGEDWLRTQDEETQRQVMGNDRYEMWRGGTPLQEFIQYTNHPIWGPGLTPKTASKVKTVIPVEVFKPAGFADVPEFATTEEAEKWAVANGLAKEVYYKGFDLSVASEINRSLAEHRAKFPKLQLNAVGNNLELNKVLRKRLRPKIEQQVDEWITQYNVQWTEKRRRDYIDQQLRKVSRRMSKNSYATATGGHHIFFSKKWASDIKAFELQLRNDVVDGWHPPGCNTVKSVMDHELAHAVSNQTALLSDGRMNDIWISASRTGNMPSLYAKKNKSEFISESWAEYLNSDEPRSVAISVGKRMEELAESW